MLQGESTTLYAAGTASIARNLKIGDEFTLPKQPTTGFELNYLTMANLTSITSATRTIAR